MRTERAFTLVPSASGSPHAACSPTTDRVTAPVTLVCPHRSPGAGTSPFPLSEQRQLLGISVPQSLLSWKLLPWLPWHSPSQAGVTGQRTRSRGSA